MPPWKRHPRRHASIPNPADGGGLAAFPLFCVRFRQFYQAVLCPDEAFAPLSPTGSGEPVPFFPVKKDGSSRVSAEPGTRCYAPDPAARQSRRRLSALCAGPEHNQVHIPSACSGNAWAGNFYQQGSQNLPDGNGASIFWRFAGLPQTPLPLSRQGRSPSAGSFLLDLWPSVWHSYGCSPSPSVGLLLSGDSSSTDLGEGEQPIETLQLGSSRQQDAERKPN